MADYPLTQTGAEVQQILNQAPTTETDLNAEILRATTKDAELQTAIADILAKIQQGTTTSNPMTNKKYVDDLIAAMQNAIDIINTKIPSEASAENQLADKLYVVTQILSNIAAFKGQFTSLAALQAVTGAKDGDLGIVRTTDSDGHPLFTFYQYMNEAWSEYFALAHHLQNKPATTGTSGAYPNNGMGRIVLSKNPVQGFPSDSFGVVQVNGTVYLLYSYNLQLYAVYNSDTQKGLGIENVVVAEPSGYNISDIADLVGNRYLSYTEDGGVYTITKPDTTTITSTTLNGVEKWRYNEDVQTYNVLTRAMINQPNTVYVIQYDFDLNGESITIPENCVLEFEGGSLSNGTIRGQNTLISTEQYKIFTNISFDGTWNIDFVDLRWFGAVSDNAAFDNAPLLKDAIKFAIVSMKSVFIPQGNYYFLSQINVYGLNPYNNTYIPISIFGENQRKNKSRYDTVPEGTKIVVDGENFMYGSELVIVEGIIQDINFTTTSNRRYTADVFNNINIRQFHFTNCNVERFNSFVNGWITNLSIIEKCSFIYNKHLLYNESSTAEVLVDSTIIDNYINGSVPYESGETSMIQGSITHSRIIGNHIDFFKYIIYKGDPSTNATIVSAIFTSNIFDYCYTFTNANISGLLFVGNAIKSNSWDYAKNTHYWEHYSDTSEDSPRDATWVFFCPHDAINATIIENNQLMYSLFLFVGLYGLKITNVTIKNNGNADFSIYLNTPNSVSKNINIEGYNIGENLINYKSYRFIDVGLCYKTDGRNPIISANKTEAIYKLYYDLVFSAVNFGEPDLNYLKLTNRFVGLMKKGDVRGSSLRLKKYENIYYIEYVSTEKVASCNLADAMTLYNAGLMGSSAFYVADYGIYMMPNSVNIDGIMCGAIKGFVFNPQFVDSNEFSYRFDTNSGTPFINKTIYSESKVKRYNGSEWIDITSNGLRFYMYPTRGTVRPPMTISKYQWFFDESLTKMIYNNNGTWIDATGTPV